MKMRSPKMIVALLVAVLILCAACSSKSEPAAGPATGAAQTGKTTQKINNPGGSDQPALIAGKTDDDKPEFFSVNPATEFFTMDTSLFGLTYDEFKKKIGRDDLMAPEDWQWWGHDMKVVYLTEGNEEFACFFQNNCFVSVYRDSANENPGELYNTAVTYYGAPSAESEYWSGSTAYEWTLSDCRYQQHTEIYQGDEGHYRQQYVSNLYEE